MSRLRYVNPISGRRHGIAEPLRDGAARGLETGPFVSILEAGKRNQLALVEPDERCVDHVFRRHDYLPRQVLPREAGAFQNLGGGRGRQHRLDADALIGELVLERMTERGNVKRDDLVHLLDVGTQQRRYGCDAGVVDEHADARIASHRGFDRCEIRLVIEIRWQRSNRASGLTRQTLGERLERCLAAGHEDEVVATLCETVGIDGADAPGGAGDEGSAFRITHAVDLSVGVQSATQLPSRSISSPVCGVNSTKTVRRGTPSSSTQMSTMALPSASRFSGGRPRRNSTRTMVTGSRRRQFAFDLDGISAGQIEVQIRHGVFLQATCETNARCANPWPKEKFSPGASMSWIMRSSGDIPAPATIRAFSSLSKARRVSFGRPEMNASSSTMKSSEYFSPRNDGVCKKRLRGSTWMIWKKSSEGIFRMLISASWTALDTLLRRLSS